MAESLKKKTVKGTLWSVIERFSVQAIQFIVMIFMARILTPAEYGIVGMITVFIAVSQALVDSGFSNALIRKQDRSQLDCSTAFYFNFVVGIILYFILFFCAHPIAKFYKEPLLVPVTHLVAISLPLNSLAVVQRALLTIKIDFKTQAKASCTAAVVSGVVGLILAYSNYGVWAIVWFQLSSTFTNVLLLWIFAKWVPSWCYSWKSFRQMFSFGSKLAATTVMNTVYLNGFQLIIGKIYSAAQLGFYTRALQFSQLPSTNISAILQRVTYPVLCSIQDEDQRLHDAFLKFINLTSFIVFPLMIGLSVLAKPIIISLIGEKWEFSAVLLSIISVSIMWVPINAINLNILQVKGKSGLLFKLELSIRLLGIAILFITVPIGIVAMCLGSVVSNLSALIIYAYFSGKLLNIKVGNVLSVIYLPLIYSIIMGICVYLCTYFISIYFLKMIVGIVVGVISYIGFTYITKYPALFEIKSFFNYKKLQSR